MRFRFKERVDKFDLSGFKLKRTDENDFRSSFQMMDLKLLRNYKDSATHLINIGLVNNYKIITPYIKYFNFSHKPKTKIKYIRGNANFLAKLNHDDQVNVVTNALNEVKIAKDQITARATRYTDLSREIRHSTVEYQKKFTLSAACIALFLIGAPLGAIIRKGGLGLPVVVAVIFFLIYYIISTIGEKTVKDGDLSPFVGMWIAIGTLTPIGIFLSYKAANDSALFDVELYKRTIKKITALFKKADDT